HPARPVVEAPLRVWITGFHLMQDLGKPLRNDVFTRELLVTVAESAAATTGVEPLSHDRPNASSNAARDASKLAALACWYTRSVTAASEGPNSAATSNAGRPDWASSVAVACRQSCSRTPSSPIDFAMRANPCVNASGSWG